MTQATLVQTLAEHTVCVFRTPELMPGKSRGLGQSPRLPTDSAEEPFFLTTDFSNSRFVNRLRDNPFIVANDVGVGGLAAIQGCSHAEEFRKEGIDLYEMFEKNASDLVVRQQLAYLLVAEENDEYLDYASKHVNELANLHEFLIWTWILDKDDCHLSKNYADRMLNVLDRTELPCYLRLKANSLLREGDNKNAVRYAITLCSSDVPWGSEGFRVLDRIDSNELPELLFPYLETESIEGTFAAYQLSGIAEWKEKSIAYLDRAKQCEQSEIATSAAEVLQWIAQEDDSN